MATTITLTGKEILIARRMIMSCLISTERNLKEQSWQIMVDRNDAHALLAKLLESTM